MDSHEALVAELTANQNRLYAYILSLLGDPNAADDVLQAVNLVLWRKAGDWDPSTSFMAWALTVARYEVMTWRKKVARDRLVFCDDTLNLIAVTDETRGEGYSRRQRMLIECFKELSQRLRDLLRKRYAQNTPVPVIAQQVDSTSGAVSQALFRARQALGRCMRSKLAEEPPQ